LSLGGEALIGKKKPGRFEKKVSTLWKEKAKRGGKSQGPVGGGGVATWGTIARQYEGKNDRAQEKKKNFETKKGAENFPEKKKTMGEG